MRLATVRNLVFAVIVALGFVLTACGGGSNLTSPPDTRLGQISEQLDESLL